MTKQNLRVRVIRKTHSLQFFVVRQNESIKAGYFNNLRYQIRKHMAITIFTFFTLLGHLFINDGDLCIPKMYMYASIRNSEI